jgi:hypothetical protein
MDADLALGTHGLLLKFMGVRRGDEGSFVFAGRDAGRGGFNRRDMIVGLVVSGLILRLLGMV